MLMSLTSKLEPGLLIQNPLLQEIYITRCSTNREDELKKHHETLVHIQLDPEGRMDWLVFT